MDTITIDMEEKMKEEFLKKIDDALDDVKNGRVLSEEEFWQRVRERDLKN